MSHEVLDNFVYPGHPVVIAFAMTEHFWCYFHATYRSIKFLGDKTEVEPYCKAQTSKEIPGAGSHVVSALELLQFVRNGEVSWEDGFTWADKTWASLTQGAYRDCRELGQVHANLVKPLLKKRTDWLFRHHQLDEKSLTVAREVLKPAIARVWGGEQVLECRDQRSGRPTYRLRLRQNRIFIYEVCDQHDPENPLVPTGKKEVLSGYLGRDNETEMLDVFAEVHLRHTMPCGKFDGPVELCPVTFANLENKEPL